MEGVETFVFCVLTIGNVIFGVEITDITWKESTNLQLYAMLVVPVLKSWMFNPNHCMDSYICVEGGLFCSADQFAKSLMNFVFSELHPSIQYFCHHYSYH